MTSSTETAWNHQMAPEDDQMVPEDDQNMQEELASDPAGPVLAADPQLPDPAAPEFSGAAAIGSAAAEPGVADSADDERPSAGAVPGPEPGSTPASPVASDSTGSGQRWREIQATFVDDPRSCVEVAAGLVDDGVKALVGSVKERQHALLSAWQGEDTGTEELRIALQHYRTFWNRLEDFSREPGASTPG